MKSAADLNDIVKKLDGQLTPEKLTDFTKGITRFPADAQQLPSYLTPLLKMLQALSRYLIAKENEAHADTPQLLKSIADQTRTLLETPDIAPEKAKKIVSEQIRDYRLFQQAVKSSAVIQGQDLENLKAVILAMDWEISDTTLQNFEAVVNPLLVKTRNHKTVHLFLKLMFHTGKYIGIQQADAPADSIAVLHEFFDHFQQIVQTNEMGQAEKRQLLEKDIQRFHELKRAGGDHLSSTEPDDVLPALSHVRSTGAESSDTDIPLTRISEIEASFDELLTPAPASSTPSDHPQRDIMDDLFSVKESPADELLDAIHLMEVQGTHGDAQAVKMLDESERFQKAGMKNFMTQKKDAKPIPEISSRLDEFFNQGVPEKEESEPVDDTLPRLDPSDSIVPFDSGDEFDPEDESDDDVDSVQVTDTQQMNKSADTILNRLETAVTSTESSLADQDLSEIDRDIQLLKKLWQDDVVKHRLLDLISAALKQTGSCHTDEQTQESQSQTDSSVPTGGIWKTIKSFFSS